VNQPGDAIGFVIEHEADAGAQPQRDKKGRMAQGDKLCHTDVNGLRLHRLEHP